MLKPIKPRDARGGQDSRDHAATGGYDLAHLLALVRDIDGQPDWRSRADLNVSYYDSRGIINPERAQKAIAAGLPPEAPNLVSRVINSVLGQEAKARSDVRVEADSAELGDVCDALNPAIKEAAREACIDMAISNAYASMVKAGIGWVEVARQSDPLAYPYRVTDVHRNEMWYDWRAQHFLLRDSRWVVRKRWYDLDVIQAAMPEYADLLGQCVSNWGDFILAGEFDDTELTTAMNREREFTVRRGEWCDSARKRLKLYEVWYRVPAQAIVMHLSPTRRVLYDENKPAHVEAVSRGLVKLSKGVTDQIRMALFAGPHRLMDVGTKKRQFPYIPFIAFRDDADRSPYGLIDGMRIPQDDHTDRYLRVKWMLQARQVLVDNDALDKKYNNENDLAGGAMRPDLLLILNADRKNANGVQIGNSMQLQAEQFAAMDRAERMVQDVPGVFGSQLGNAQTGVTSGLAINSLVEQGMVSLGEMNDNYRNARRAVYEAVLELVVEDHSVENMQVSVGEGSAARVIVLNSKDENGKPVNQIEDAPIRIGLMDIPSSPAFRMQQQQQLAQVIGALQANPKAVEVLTPAFIESMSMDNEVKRQALEDYRRMSGMPPAGDRAARDQIAKEQAQAAQASQAAQQQGAAAQLSKLQGDAAASIAKARLTNAQALLAAEQAKALATPDIDQLIDQTIAETV